MKRRTLIAAVPAAVAVAGCGGGGAGDFASIGSGGTGITGGEGVGSGGTGITSAAVGSISGFGSVIVNGVRFDTDRAALTIADADTLKLGMTVQVQGVVNSDQLEGVASTLRSAADVRGAAEAVDVAQGSLTVWSTPIYTDAATVFAGGLTALHDVQVGDPLQIHGLPGTGDGLRATRIERIASVGAPVISGVAQAVDASSSTFRVGGLRVGYVNALLQAAGLSSSALEGQVVRVRGDASSRSTWGAAGVEPWYPLSRSEGQGVSIEGLVSQFASLGSLRVDSVTVDASQARIQGRASSVAQGARLEVTGAWRGGVLVASRVKVRGVAPDPATAPGNGGGGNGDGEGNGNGNGNSGSGRGDEDSEYSARGNVGALRSASEFKVQGQDIDAGRPGVVFVGGTSANLRNGTRVLVTGSRVVDDVLIADRVQFL